MRIDIDKVKKVTLEYGHEWIRNEYINNTTKSLIRYLACGKTFEKACATVKKIFLSNKSYNIIKSQ